MYVKFLHVLNSFPLNVFNLLSPETSDQQRSIQIVVLFAKTFIMSYFLQISES